MIPIKVRDIAAGMVIVSNNPYPQISTIITAKPEQQIDSPTEEFETSDCFTVEFGEQTFIEWTDSIEPWCFRIA